MTQQTYYWFGRLPHEDMMGDRRSYNHRDNEYEPGVAVYPGTIEGDTLTLDLREIDAVSVIFDRTEIKDLRAVTGVVAREGRTDEFGYRITHTGANGEPLLDPVTSAQRVTGVRRVQAILADPTKTPMILASLDPADLVFE